MSTCDCCGKVVTDRDAPIEWAIEPQRDTGYLDRRRLCRGCALAALGREEDGTK